jgi:hypothetical protein
MLAFSLEIAFIMRILKIANYDPKSLLCLRASLSPARTKNLVMNGADALAVYAMDA